MAEQSPDEEIEDATTDRRDRHRELRDIFVTVTGSTEFTQSQDEQSQLRSAAPEESLSGPVTEIAKSDGLSDTYPDLEYATDGG